MCPILAIFFLYITNIEFDYIQGIYDEMVFRILSKSLMLSALNDHLYVYFIVFIFSND